MPLLSVCQNSTAAPGIGSPFVSSTRPVTRITSPAAVGLDGKAAASFSDGDVSAAGSVAVGSSIGEAAAVGVGSAVAVGSAVGSTAVVAVGTGGGVSVATTAGGLVGGGAGVSVAAGVAAPLQPATARAAISKLMGITFLVFMLRVLASQGK